MLKLEEFNKDKELIEDAKKIFLEKDEFTEFFIIELTNEVIKKTYCAEFRVPMGDDITSYSNILKSIDMMKINDEEKNKKRQESGIKFIKEHIIYPDPNVFDRWIKHYMGYMVLIINKLLESAGFGSEKDSLMVKND